MNQPNFLREPGQHRVRVVAFERKKSKAGNPMLTVDFEDQSGRQVRGYYVANNKWGLAALKELKASLGLADTAKAEEFVGRFCLVVLSFQDPNKTDGKIYTQIDKTMPIPSAYQDEEIPPPIEDESLPF
jgi:hypothetical protein